MTASITFTYNVAQLERELQDGYVYTVHYTVNGVSDQVDEEGNPIQIGAYGSLGLERPASELIPFAELTEQTVIDWVKEKFGEEKVAEIEAALTAQLNEKLAPSKAAGLPWVNNG
jgi:hypothetical protein